MPYDPALFVLTAGPIDTSQHLHHIPIRHRVQRQILPTTTWIRYHIKNRLRRTYTQPFHRYRPTPTSLSPTCTMSTGTTTTLVNPLEARLIHALEQIMGQAPDSPIHRALVANAYVTIAEVCAISEDQLKDLEAPQTMQEAIDIYNGQAKTKRGGANTSFKLPTGHMNNIKLFVIYLQSCIHDKQRDLSQDDDWNKLTRDEYNEFRMRNPVVHLHPQLNRMLDPQPT